MKSFCLIAAIAATVSSAAVHADAARDLKAGAIGALIGTVFSQALNASGDVQPPTTPSQLVAPSPSVSLQADTKPNLAGEPLGMGVNDASAESLRQPRCDASAASMGECRRGDYSPAGLQDGAIVRYSKQKRGSKPQEAADRACQGTASFPMLIGNECQQFLQPYVEADFRKQQADSVGEAQEARERKRVAETEEKKRFDDPQKSAANLDRAEKRFAAAAAALKKAQPSMKRAKIEPMSELAKASCRGMVNDSKYATGSIEARMILTDCWAGFTNSAAEQVETAAKEVQNVPLRLGEK